MLTPLKRYEQHCDACFASSSIYRSSFVCFLLAGASSSVLTLTRSSNEQLDDADLATSRTLSFYPPSQSLAVTGTLLFKVTSFTFGTFFPIAQTLSFTDPLFLNCIYQHYCHHHLPITDQWAQTVALTLSLWCSMIPPFFLLLLLYFPSCLHWIKHSTQLCLSPRLLLCSMCALMLMLSQSHLSLKVAVEHSVNRLCLFKCASPFSLFAVVVVIIVVIIDSHTNSELTEFLLVFCCCWRHKTIFTTSESTSVSLQIKLNYGSRHTESQLCSAVCLSEQCHWHSLPLVSSVQFSTVEHKIKKICVPSVLWFSQIFFSICCSFPRSQRGHKVGENRGERWEKRNRRRSRSAQLQNWVPTEVKWMKVHTSVFCVCMSSLCDSPFFFFINCTKNNSFFFNYSTFESPSRLAGDDYTTVQSALC